MNHIARLQAENEMLKEFIADFSKYASSSKFHADPMMNVGDYFLRLSELRNKMLDNGLSGPTP